MLFVPNNKFKKYIFADPSSIHSFKNTIVIHDKNKTLYFYENNELIKEIKNVKKAIFEDEKVFYLARKIYYYNLNSKSTINYDNGLDDIIYFKDMILTYSNSIVNMINIEKDTFYTSSQINDEIKTGNELIFIRNGDCIYILDENFINQHIIEFEINFFYILENRVMIINDDKIAFFDFNGKLKKEIVNEFNSTIKTIIKNDNVYILKEDIIEIFKIKNDKLSMITTLNLKKLDLNVTNNQKNKDLFDDVVQDNNEHKKQFDIFIDNNFIYIYDTFKLKRLDLLNYAKENLLYKFDKLYISPHFYFGVFKNKIYFYELNGTDIDKIELNSAIYEIVFEDRIYIKTKNLNCSYIYIIEKSENLRYKIIQHEEILNIENNYYIYKNNDEYYVCHTNNEINRLEVDSTIKKYIMKDDKVFFLTKQNYFNEIENIIDFYFLENSLILIKENSILIYRDDVLVGDIIIEYSYYFIHKKLLYFVNLNEITVIGNHMQHLVVQNNELYSSGDFIVNKENCNFYFTETLENDKDEFEELKETLEERHVKLVNLSQDAERLAVKADEFQKIAQKVKEKKKKYWFF